jgi:hypothetical protein
VEVRKVKGYGRKGQERLMDEWVQVWGWRKGILRRTRIEKEY